MTFNEAITLVKECGLNIEGTRHAECEKVVLNALERRTPKKPRTDDDGWLCCPNCDETFPMFDSLHRRLNCCGCCGQRLDWSKANTKRSDTE